MSIYKCEYCGEFQDNNKAPCADWSVGLVCEDCVTELTYKKKDSAIASIFEALFNFSVIASGSAAIIAAVML